MGLASHLEEQRPPVKSPPGTRREESCTRRHRGAGPHVFGHLREAASEMKTSITLLAMQAGLFLPRQNEQHGRALRPRQEHVCPLLARLLPRGSIFRLAAHSTESKEEVGKYSWDKGTPSNYVSASRLCTLQVVLR